MSPIDPSLRIASVTLAVGDLDRSVAFYEHVLGLPVIARDARSAQLGVDPSDPALVLEAIERPEPAPLGSTGLFHVAWLHPTRAALADSVRRVAGAGARLQGASDHGVSEALYLSDPDGLGIELYADRPRESWTRGASGQGVAMVTLPLDLEDLLAQGGEQPGAEAAPGTAVGHVHMQVADVPRALAFYRDVLGFEEQARLPSAAFVSAGGYHHHIGINSWRSRGGAPAPDSAPGLRLIEFELAHPAALDALTDELSQAASSSTPAGATGALASDEHGLAVSDPDGVALAFSLSGERDRATLSR
ncbi:MAG TPA: VOC family protein [Solirubrobacteraceae bacterium]